MDRPLARVEIHGLRSTRPVVILRELSVGEGEVIDWNLLRRDRMRLFDLGLFSRISFGAERDTLLDRPVLLIDVEERMTWLAYPILNYDEDDGFVYGAYGSGINLRGMNERASLTVLAGGRTGFSAAYATPWLGERRLGAGFSAYASRRRNRGEDLIQKEIGARIWTEPRRGPEIGFPLEIGAEQVRSAPDGEPADGAEVNETRDDHRWVRLGVWRDSRAYRARAITGSLASFAFELHGGIIGGTSDVQRYQFDVLRVISTGSGTAITAASRLLWSRGAVPSYLRVHLGGASTLRGHPPSAYGGESRWHGWIEQRFPLLAKRTIRLWKDRATLDFTVDGTLFVDGGSVWEGDELQEGSARARWGFGGGLRVVLPFVEVASLDLATDGERVRVHATGGLRL